MDIKKSTLYKAIVTLLKNKKNVESTKPRINEKIVHDMDQFDPDGKKRKLHKGIPWSSEEAEQEAWDHVVYCVKKAGIGQFINRKFKSYEKTVDLNLCQKRRKFKKISKEEINKKYKNDYKIGEIK